MSKYAFLQAKIRDWNPPHMFAVIKKMADMKRNSVYQRVVFNIDDEQLRDREDFARRFLQNCAADDEIGEQDIMDAHSAVIASYGYAKRGRPLGSKNRPKPTYEHKSQPEITDIHSVEELETFLDDVVKTSEQAETSSIDTPTASSDLYNKFVEDQARQDRQLNRLVGVNEEISSVKKYMNLVDIVVAELNKKVEELKNAKATIIEIKHQSLPETTHLGVQHKNFELLLRICMARLNSGDSVNVWLAGPPGTGKSSAAMHVAKALNLAFHTTGALNAKHELLGFENAHKYVTTEFRQAWEFGGIYCLDEIDASNPTAVLALNGALANKLCAFPDKTVTRHANCIIIATANTFGSGATSEYNARFKMDAASLDRFVFLDWPIDDALEASFTTNTEWLESVRLMRKKLIRSGIKGVMITPRATIYGDALIRSGLAMKDVITLVIKKGMTDAQWTQLLNTPV